MGKVVVVYAGGFQPFHTGHLSSYLQAKNAFPKADFYVAASADTKTRPIPYDIKKFLATQAGVNPKDFPDIVVKSPIRPDEILSHYDPHSDIYILVRSERDPVSYTKKDGSPGYYQPFVGIDKCEPFEKHGYVFVTQKKDFQLNGQDVYSGTQVRTLYQNSNDDERINLVNQLYPRSKQHKKIKQVLDKYIGTTMKESVNELIQCIKPLLTEATIEQKYKLYKLLHEAKWQVESEEEALHFATQAHAGQERATGEPYIHHPMGVADTVRKYKKSKRLDDLISAALLHDTIEDTNTTHDDLEILFGGLVASLVKELTSDPEKIKQMGKMHYLAHKMATMSSYALVIKLADRLDNVKDIKTAKTPEWRERYKKETEHLLDYIEKHRVLSGTHRKLIDLIRNKINEIDTKELIASENLDYLEE